MDQCDFGVIGLGRIGGGLALQAMEKGYQVAGLDLSPPGDELRDAGLRACDDRAMLVATLKSPRVIFIYIHAGAAIDAELDSLLPLLSPGDIVVDGGNSYWGEARRRADRAKEAGVHFVDLGTSGGVSGARTGACFMAGGDPSAVAQIEPLLVELAVPGGFVYAGASGAGHFVKLVHNGVEFGMMQAIGEGVDLMERFNGDLDIAAVLECWRHGSIVRSYLVDLMAEAYAHRAGIEGVPTHVEDTGEVNWLVADALRMEVPIPVITQSVIQLFASRDDRLNWARAVALMRLGFGGHALGPVPSIAEERKTSRTDWAP